MFFFNSVDSIRTFFPRKMESFFIGRRLAGDYTLSNPTKAISVLSKMDNEAVMNSYRKMVKKATEGGGVLTYGMITDWALKPWLNSHKDNRLRFLNELVVECVELCVREMALWQNRMLFHAGVARAMFPNDPRLTAVFEKREADQMAMMRGQLEALNGMFKFIGEKMGELQKPDSKKVEPVEAKPVPRMMSLNGDK